MVQYYDDRDDPWTYPDSWGGGGGGGAPTPPPPGVSPSPPVAPFAGGGGGGGGQGGGGGARPQFNFRNVPGFVPPVFNRPTFAEAQNEPGYQFRLSGGQNAMERSAAARGVLRTGGTLRDLTEYGQNFAAQEYNNVYNRALGAYDRVYRGAYDAYAPRLAEWQFLSNAELQAGMAQFNKPMGGGGGGGGGIPEPPGGGDPGPPPKPPFLWKPGTDDPDVKAWLDWQQQQGQGN